MRWVVPFPTGRGTVSFRTTQVSFWLSSPHLPHFNYHNREKKRASKEKVFFYQKIKLNEIHERTTKPKKWWKYEIIPLIIIRETCGWGFLNQNIGVGKVFVRGEINLVSHCGGGIWKWCVCGGGDKWIFEMDFLLDFGRIGVVRWRFTPKFFSKIVVKFGE